jgi:anti-anti-sigma factor
MDMELSEVEGVKKVILVGRLDTAGVSLIETRFAAGVASAGRHTMVDLTQVEFLASLGVRMLITTTRALSGRGARLVMYGATPPVMEIIETMGFSDIVPVVDSESEAVAYLTA